MKYNGSCWLRGENILGHFPIERHRISHPSKSSVCTQLVQVGFENFYSLVDANIVAVHCDQTFWKNICKTWMPPRSPKPTVFIKHSPSRSLILDSHILQRYHKSILRQKETGWAPNYWHDCPPISTTEEELSRRLHKASMTSAPDPASGIKSTCKLGVFTLLVPARYRPARMADCATIRYRKTP